MAVPYRSATYLVRDNPAAGGDTVVVMFDPWSAAPGDLDGEFFAESFFRRRAIPAIGVKAARNDWYLGPDMDAVLDAVRTAARGRRVVVYGASMGGYAALNYHDRLRAARLLLFAPQFSVDPRAAPFETRYRREAAALDFARDGIALRPPAADGVLFFDPASLDAAHARLILAVHPLAVVRTAFAGHHPLAMLHETRLLESTILEALGTHFDAAALQRALRQRRRCAPTAWTELAAVLHGRGRAADAAAALERAARCREALAAA